MDLSLVGGVQAGDAVEDGGLAAARGSEDGRDAAGEMGVHLQHEAGVGLSDSQAQQGVVHGLEGDTPGQALVDREGQQGQHHGGHDEPHGRLVVS